MKDARQCDVASIAQGTRLRARVTGAMLRDNGRELGAVVGTPFVAGFVALVPLGG